jgi:hypothetical protein
VVLFLLAVFCASFLLAEPGCAAAKGIDPVGEGWMWQIAVIPPSEGWNSPQGESVWMALAFAAGEVNESHGGVNGHDVRFFQVTLPEREDLPLDLPGMLREWKTRRVIAVLSFADDETNLSLMPLLRVEEMPLLLAWGEWISLRDGDGQPEPFVFALSLFRRFRMISLVEELRRTVPQGTGIVLVADRLDPVLAASSALLTRLLQDRGFVPLPVWIAGAGDRDVRFRLREAENAGGEILVSLLDVMGTLDLWRQIKETGSPLAIWYGGSMSPLLADRKGLVLSDQDELLLRDPSLRGFRLRIWDVLRVHVADAALAARAYALARWFFSGLRETPPSDIARLPEKLGNATGIPFGEEILSIDPATHRPRERRVAVWESDGTGWFLRRIVVVPSGAFPE